jgi:hypothetical protein
VVERVLVRAFDKAVRRKALAFAADAVGLWEWHVGEGGTRTAGDAERVGRYGRWEMLQGICIDHEAHESRNISVTRHTWS